MAQFSDFLFVYLIRFVNTNKQSWSFGIAINFCVLVANVYLTVGNKWMYISRLDLLTKFDEDIRISGENRNIRVTGYICACRF